MIVIIIPVRNEENLIADVALSISDYCKRNVENYKLVFVDDRSADDTYAILNGLNIPNKILMRNKFDPGKGSALKTAYVLVNSSIKLKDDDYVVFMDGDGQIDPAEINTFIKIGELYSSDIVIGNKRHKYSTTVYGFTRKIISRTYNFMIRKLFGFDFEDTQCGLKVMKKKALDAVIASINVKKFAFDLELIIACKEKGFRVVDAPVYIQRRINRGSVNFISILQTFIDTMRIWYRKQRGYYARD